MDLEGIILSEVSDRERQILYDITSVWNLKSNTNVFIYKTETDSQSIQIYGYQRENRGGGRGIK